MNLAQKAMMFAMEKHKDHKRKYTGNPYTDHLAEVAGIVATVSPLYSEIKVAVAWLHDVMEDCGVTFEELVAEFGDTVAMGVYRLSDLEQGNRKTRKALSRIRLSASPKWVQDIKVADLISNTSSIVEHDPDFAKVYLEEKRLLLDVLTLADETLMLIARKQTEVIE